MKRKFDSPNNGVAETNSDVSEQKENKRRKNIKRELDNFLELCKNNDHELVLEKLKQDKDYVYAVSKSNTNTLMYACKNGNMSLAKLFLEKDKRFLYCNNNNLCNAFHYSCMGGNWELAKFMLDNNPKFLKSLSKDGRSAFDLALEHHQHAICDNLLEISKDFFVKNQKNLPNSYKEMVIANTKLQKRRLLAAPTEDLFATIREDSRLQSTIDILKVSMSKLNDPNPTPSIS